MANQNDEKGKDKKIANADITVAPVETKGEQQMHGTAVIHDSTKHGGDSSKSYFEITGINVKKQPPIPVQFQNNFSDGSDDENDSDKEEKSPASYVNGKNDEDPIKVKEPHIVDTSMRQLNGSVDHNADRTKRPADAVIDSHDQISKTNGAIKPSKFKLVKVQRQDPVNRGRWTFKDFNQQPPSFQSGAKTDNGKGSGSSSTCSSVYYVAGEHPPSENPLLNNNDIQLNQNTNIAASGAASSQPPMSVLTTGTSQPPNSVVIMPPGVSGAQQSRMTQPMPSAATPFFQYHMPHHQQFVPSQYVTSVLQMNGAMLPLDKKDEDGVPSNLLQTQLPTDLEAVLPSSADFTGQQQTGPDDKDPAGASSDSSVAIDNKIEQAMDLVKSHLMYAVKEEVEVLKDQIRHLVDRNQRLEMENLMLRGGTTQPEAPPLTAPLTTAVTAASTPPPVEQPQVPPPPADLPQSPAVTTTVAPVTTTTGAPPRTDGLPMVTSSAAEQQQQQQQPQSNVPVVTTTDGQQLTQQHVVTTLPPPVTTTTST